MFFGMRILIFLLRTPTYHLDGYLQKLEEELTFYEESSD